MSPLQYQKRLRLQEARRLMIGEHLDAASAGYRVGYGRRGALQPRVQKPVWPAAHARCRAAARVRPEASGFPYSVYFPRCARKIDTKDRQYFAAAYANSLTHLLKYYLP